MATIASTMSCDSRRGMHIVRRAPLVAVAVAAAGVTAVAALAATGTGPSSSQTPYLVATQPGVKTTSVLTVGDAVPKGGGGTYKMVGIPDGLGAFDNGNGTFTLLMNHELTSSQGTTRAHGAKGAFVSRWVVSKGSYKVLSGEDLIKDLTVYTGTKALNRLCSADLPPISAFWSGGLGYDGRIFMNGEESSNVGRAFAHFVTGSEAGKSYELPSLGKFAWENSVAHPDPGTSTVVVGLDDGTGGQVYVYKGTKHDSGTAVHKAGLDDGELYGIKVDGYPSEPAAGIPANTPFIGYELGDVSAISGAQLESDSVAGAVTSFQRPEDGAWDTTNPSVFYFVTTADINDSSRLWKLDFDDPTDPAAGGTVSMLLDGSEGPRMMDNITVNDRGQVLIQEDPGNKVPTGQANYLAKLWLYDPSSDALTQIAEHDPARFTPGEPGYLTDDEESSGIIPVPFLGEGKYLLDVQAHYSISPDPDGLVQGGQLLALHVPPGKFKK
jgi:hypothetical protein